MPDDYYVSQYSGEEIDALLGKAGSSVQVACNPNLLDNWYFGHPVNQRNGHISLQGIPVYNDAACTSFLGNQIEPAVTCIKSGDNYERRLNGQGGGFVKAADVVRGYTEPGYSVDRWWFDNDSNAATINLTNDGIKFSAIDSATGVSSLKQDIDPMIVSALRGKTVTLSCFGKTDATQQVLIFADGQIVAVNYSVPVNGVCMTTLTYTFPETLTSVAIFAYGRSLAGAGEGTILAIKLELGDRQTLAHKDASGNWVLNEIPKLGDQLEECQRYLFSANKKEYPYACIGSGYISADGSEAVFIVPLPVTLRAVPACTVSGRIRIDTSYGEVAFVSSVSVFNIGCGAVCVHGKIEGTATAHAPCYALLESNANNLLLSADF